MDPRPLLVRMPPLLEAEVRALAESDARSINWMVCGLAEAALGKQTKRAEVVRRLLARPAGGYTRATP